MLTIQLKFDDQGTVRSVQANNITEVAYIRNHLAKLSVFYREIFDFFTLNLNATCHSLPLQKQS